MGNLRVQFILHSYEDCITRITESNLSKAYPYVLSFGGKINLNHLEIYGGSLTDFEDIAKGILGEITRIKEEGRKKDAG